MKTEKIIYRIIVLAILFCLALACERSITENNHLENGTAQFSIRLNDNATTSGTNAWLPQVTGQPFLSQFDPNAEEALILVLDAASWESGTDFQTAWFAENESELLSLSAWDASMDFWDNAQRLLKSYTGAHYRFAGSYILTRNEGSLSGTINAAPGLNYFLLALRNQGETHFSEEVFFTVSTDDVNQICFGCTPPAVEITAPADNSVSGSNIVMVEGTISDASVTAMRLRMNQISLDIPVTNGAFSQAAVLTARENTIIASAANELGSGADTIRISQEFAPPALTATVVWNSDADLGLGMANPDSVICSADSGDQGGMTLDLQASSGPGGLENISVREPLSGIYRVGVQNNDGIAGYGTTATIYIFMNGQLIATENHTFSIVDVQDTWFVGEYTLP